MCLNERLLAIKRVNIGTLLQRQPKHEQATKGEKEEREL